VFAEGVAPDGICLDAEGVVWVSTGVLVRASPNGEVLQRVELPAGRAPYALMLGGPDRRTLFSLTAEWHPDHPYSDNLQRLTDGPRTGEILTIPVSVPGAGRP
jgi:sugar lactone lactonase YvrE